MYNQLVNTLPDERIIEIISMAVHPSAGRYVATGERGRVPKAVVWDVATQKSVSILRGFHERGVVQLSFSTGAGDVLITVGGDRCHCVALYDWKRSVLLCTAVHSPLSMLVRKQLAQSMQATAPGAALGTQCQLVKKIVLTITILQRI